MNRLTQINKWLGWILSIGLLLSQVMTFILIDPHIALVFLLTSGTALPFFIIAVVSCMNRKAHEKLIRNGLIVGISCIIMIPILFPLFFDRELIYISLIGLFLAGIMWWFRKLIEIQLLIVHTIGSALLFFLTLVWISAI